MSNTTNPSTEADRIKKLTRKLNTKAATIRRLKGRVAYLKSDNGMLRSQLESVLDDLDRAPVELSQRLGCLCKEWLQQVSDEPFRSSKEDTILRCIRDLRARIEER